MRLTVVEFLFKVEFWYSHLEHERFGKGIGVSTSDANKVSFTLSLNVDSETLFQTERFEWVLLETKWFFLDFNDYSSHGLSSYGLFLMVVNFLQRYESIDVYK